MKWVVSHKHTQPYSWKNILKEAVCTSDLAWVGCNSEIFRQIIKKGMSQRRDIWFMCATIEWTCSPVFAFGCVISWEKDPSDLFCTRLHFAAYSSVCRASQKLMTQLWSNISKVWPCIACLHIISECVHSYLFSYLKKKKRPCVLGLLNIEVQLWS